MSENKWGHQVVLVNLILEKEQIPTKTLFMTGAAGSPQRLRVEGLVSSW